jgi:hypothetical protein
MVVGKGKQSDGCGCLPEGIKHYLFRPQAIFSVHENRDVFLAVY